MTLEPHRELARQIIRGVLEPHMTANAKGGIVPSQVVEQQLDALAGCVACTIAGTNFDIDAFIYFHQALAQALEEVSQGREAVEAILAAPPAGHG